jgi:hypothetical protein
MRSQTCRDGSPARLRGACGVARRPALPSVRVSTLDCVHLRIDPNGLPDDAARMLFEAWVHELSKERLGLAQAGSSQGSGVRTASFGDPTNNHFGLRWSGLDVEVTEAVGVDQDVVQTILEDASARVAAADFGDTVVYRVEMKLSRLDPISGALHFARILGDQVHIEGSRRLANVVLLDFEEGLLANTPEPPQPFAPPSQIQVAIFAPGPGPSDWSRKLAEEITELVAAICALATGRPVEYAVPLLFPAENADAEQALGRRYDPAILGLARDSISLDPFGDLQALGGPDAALRVRGALLAYHSALKQTSPDVAVMLFVTSIEALISPRHEWGKQKVTQRFVKTMVELCPEAVDELLAHANVEEAFAYRKKGGVNRQRRELLERIYETRSTPTHTGLGSSPMTMALMSGGAETMRVALLSDLTRSAILNFLTAPRSSLIGHPTVDPPNECPETTTKPSEPGT